MKIRPISDLHLELCPSLPLGAVGEDLIVLAGDIAIYADAIRIGRQVAQRIGVPVIMVAGNHEFFRDSNNRHHTWESTIRHLGDSADHVHLAEPGCVTFLEKSEVRYSGVRFIGATLWTDMNLFGDDWLVRLMISRQLIDYRKIKSVGTERLTSEHVIVRHKETLDFLARRLAHSFDGPTVVVTHHAPSVQSLDARYRSDKMSAAFASSLEWLILKYSPDLWIHGHTHVSCDYRLGHTRVVCNPRGYAPAERNSRFDRNLLIEI